MADPKEFPNLHTLDHPLIQHKLSLLRRSDTPTSAFRQLLKEIALLMGYELTRALPLTSERIETPVCGHGCAGPCGAKAGHRIDFARWVGDGGGNA